MKLRYQIGFLAASVVFVALIFPALGYFSGKQFAAAIILAAVIAAQAVAVWVRIKRRRGLEAAVRDAFTIESIKDSLFQLRHQLVAAEDDKWGAINRAIISLEAVKRYLSGSNIQESKVNSDNELPEVAAALEEREKFKPGSVQYQAWDDLAEMWKKFPGTNAPLLLESARARREDAAKLSRQYDLIVQALKKH